MCLNSHTARLYFGSFLGLERLTVCTLLTMFVVIYFNLRIHFMYERPYRWGKTLLDFVLPPVSVGGIVTSLIIKMHLSSVCMCRLCFLVGVFVPCQVAAMDKCQRHIRNCEQMCFKKGKVWMSLNCFQIYAALNIFFGMASIGLLTVVAIDRYLTICRPDIGIYLLFPMNLVHST